MAGEPCPLGFFCSGGIADKQACEAGPGRFCPIGGGSAEGALCPVGSFCQGEQAAPVECTDTEPGSYCKQVHLYVFHDRVCVHCERGA
jgi:hypothetical protein